MSKGAGEQVVKNELDPATKEHMRRTFGAAAAAGAQPYTPYQGQTVAGVSSLAPEAIERMRQASNFGMGGMQQMANLAMGDYGALTPAFQRAQEQAIAAGNEQATRAGAFGGSRHGVAQGELQANVANQQAMLGVNAAQQLAQMGMGQNAAQFGAGDYMRNVQQEQLTDQQRRFMEARDWDQRNLGILTGAMGGPSGSTQTTPQSRNVLGGVAGGAMAGSPFGLPGMIGGGLLGGFGLI